MKIYWAAPLFNAAERTFNADVARGLERFGHSVYLPQDHEPRERTGRAVFEADVAGIDSCDVVVALLDGADPDSGTCWECGYAHGKKPVVVVRTDIRSGDDPRLGPCNLMPWFGADHRSVLAICGTGHIAVDLVASYINDVLLNIAE